VRLAEERQQFWAQLKELAGLEIAPAVKERLLGDRDAEYEQKLAAVRAEYEAQIATVKATYARTVARQMAEALLRGGSGKSVGELLAAGDGRSAVGGNGGNGANGTGLAPAAGKQHPLAWVPVRFAQDDKGKGARDDDGKGIQDAAASLIGAAAAVAPSTTIAQRLTPIADAPTGDELAIEPHIDSARCTSCNECTNLNGKLFAYNASKQATIKDPKAGTFQQLVLAAERCPVGIIHPGTPLNPKEKDLAKWVKRAEPFN
jgi:ferredoxin